MRSKIFKISVCLIVGLVFVACGSNPDDSKDSKSSSPKSEVKKTGNNSSDKYKCKDNDQVGDLKFSSEASGDLAKIVSTNSIGDSLNCTDDISWKFEGGTPGIQVMYTKVNDTSEIDDVFSEAEAVVSVVFSNVTPNTLNSIKMMKNHPFITAKEKIADFEGTSQWLIALKSERKFEVSLEQNELSLTFR